jgi:hypothetical protein
MQKIKMHCLLQKQKQKAPTIDTLTISKMKFISLKKLILGL